MKKGITKKKLSGDKEPYFHLEENAVKQFVYHYKIWCLETWINWFASNKFHINMSELGIEGRRIVPNSWIWRIFKDGQWSQLNSFTVDSTWLLQHSKPFEFNMFNWVNSILKQSSEFWRSMANSYRLFRQTEKPRHFVFHTHGGRKMSDTTCSSSKHQAYCLICRNLLSFIERMV